MKTSLTVVLCALLSLGAKAQFDLSQAYAIESNFHIEFNNNESLYEAVLPKEFAGYDSVKVVFHDTLMIDNQLAMRMKLHVINTKNDHYIWQQTAVPLKLKSTSIEPAIAPDTPPTNLKYVQIGAFDHEDGAHELSKTAILFKTEIIKVSGMWKVVIPYTVGLYSEVKKYHEDAFITFY
ncbi:hypothetical protein [Marinoscillum pacificum]|uniref:hypothetical protein n=1 Tax=Marinoscillum pacificum TaxID=392723 RepID=UPI002157D5D9|nr:hypothetical protein [Marinoscillum pacificum]